MNAMDINRDGYIDISEYATGTLVQDMLSSTDGYDINQLYIDGELAKGKVKYEGKTYFDGNIANGKVENAFYVEGELVNGQNNCYIDNNGNFLGVALVNEGEFWGVFIDAQGNRIYGFD